MKDESTENRLDVSEISKELSEGRLSRRGLADQLKVLGIGFGAAVVLGVAGAHAATAPDAAVALRSTNPTIDSIIKGPQAPVADLSTRQQRTAYYRYYHRYYSRGYNRYYNRY